MQEPNHHIRLSPSSAVRILGTIALLLAVINIAGQLITHLYLSNETYYLVRIFNLDSEKNIPTAFSVLLLLFSSLLLWVISTQKLRSNDANKIYWVILAIGFMFMAADEAWQWHERLIEPTRALFNNDLPGIFNFAWVIPGLVFVLLLALFYLRFLIQLPAKTRRLFLTAAAVYLGGAIGVEILGGYHAGIHGYENIWYELTVALEETLEMAGIILFIGALLRYHKKSFGNLHFRFTK